MSHPPWAHSVCLTPALTVSLQTGGQPSYLQLPGHQDRPRHSIPCRLLLSDRGNLALPGPPQHSQSHTTTSQGATGHSPSQSLARTGPVMNPATATSAHKRQNPAVSLERPPRCPTAAGIDKRTRELESYSPLWVPSLTVSPSVKWGTNPTSQACCQD